MMSQFIIQQCKKLLDAYEEWLLGYMKMPEDEHPDFSINERKLNQSHWYALSTMVLE